MTENTHPRITREEAATVAGRSLRQINRWMKTGKVSVEYERRPVEYKDGRRGWQVYATLDAGEVLAAAGVAVRHTGGNAEDCPACVDPNPPYPFLCPGTNRTADGS